MKDLGEDKRILKVDIIKNRQKKGVVLIMRAILWRKFYKKFLYLMSN